LDDHQFFSVASLAWLAYDVAITADSEVRALSLSHTRRCLFVLHWTGRIPAQVSHLSVGNSSLCRQQSRRSRVNAYKIVYLLLKVHAVIVLRSATKILTQKRRGLTTSLQFTGCLWVFYYGISTF
jgi:hypothetical protein